MTTNPYLAPTDSVLPEQSWKPSPGLLATAATIFFFVGVFFNNASISTNDYTAVVCLAVVAFACTLLATALSWRCQRMKIRIWYVFIAVASVSQLVDAVGRRLAHLW